MIFYFVKKIIVFSEINTSKQKFIWIDKSVCLSVLKVKKKAEAMWSNLLSFVGNLTRLPAMTAKLLSHHHCSILPFETNLLQGFLYHLGLVWPPDLGKHETSLQTNKRSK